MIEATGNTQPLGVVRVRGWAWGLLLLVFALIAYEPVWRCGYIWDDDAHVTGNKALEGVGGLWRIWGEVAATPQYYPLVHTTFWVEHWLWGLRPLGYHVDNVLLHGLGALLAWRVLWRLGVCGAWLGAAVFALHPLMVESVAWVTERKNVLSGVFYLGALLWYLRFEGVGRGAGESGVFGAGDEVVPGADDQASGGRRWGCYWVALLLFVCALLSKTVVCTLPAVVVVLLWWKRGRVGWAQVWALVPLFVLGAGLGLVTAWLEKHQVGAAGADWELSWVQRCLVAGRALWFYAGKLVWPHPLIFIYPRWEVEAGVWWQYLFPVAALGVISVLWLLRGRMGRGPLAGVLCFAGTLFPALGFVDVYPMRYSFVADHFAYLASLGLIALGTAGVVGLVQRRGRARLPGAGAAVLLAVLGLLSRHQCLMYRDVETLWTTTLKKNPSCWMAHNNLGKVLEQQNRLDEAVGHYQKALEINPDCAETHFDLGVVLQRDGGQLDEAARHYRMALQIMPDFARAHNNLGNVLQMRGRLDEAIGHYKKAIAVKSDYVDARCNLGVALQQAGRTDEAILQYQKALEINPHDTATLNNLGSIFENKGRLDNAMVQYRKAIETNPSSAESYYNAGNILDQKRQHGEAIKHYQEALRISPDHVEALNNLASLLATCEDASLRDGARAVELAQRADRLTGGGDPVVLGTLGAAYAETGAFPEAMLAVRRGIGLAEAQGNAAQADILQGHLKLYQGGQPLREAR